MDEDFAERIMKKFNSGKPLFGRKQITVVFTVKEELIPGKFYDPQDFADIVWQDIDYRLVSYDPELVSTKVEDVG